jgi:hypothetical protein
MTSDVMRPQCLNSELITRFLHLVPSSAPFPPLRMGRDEVRAAGIVCNCEDSTTMQLSWNENVKEWLGRYELTGEFPNLTQRFPADDPAGNYRMEIINL